MNVDARGRQQTEQALSDPSADLFDEAQRQIFKLMKFDSYPRFLKSEVYRRCLSGDSDAQIDADLLLQPVVVSTTPGKLKKSLSNAEDRRRKSLLPWHRKCRSKSKDRGESEYGRKKGEEEEGGEDLEASLKKGANEVHSSKSSLTSLDLAITSSMHVSCIFS